MQSSPFCSVSIGGKGCLNLLSSNFYQLGFGRFFSILFLIIYMTGTEFLRNILLCSNDSRTEICKFQVTLSIQFIYELGGK